jgi:hypothetical protein
MDPVNTVDAVRREYEKCLVKWDGQGEPAAQETIERLFNGLIPLEPDAKIGELEKERDGAYLERNRLVSLLSKIFPAGLKKTAIEGWDPEWHNCVFIDLPSGQASWHFHDNEAYLFDHLRPYAGEWDGHSTGEKYARIAGYKPRGCGVCGMALVKISPRYPKGAPRMVCPTCMADRLAMIHEHSAADYGVAYAAKPAEERPSITMGAERAAADAQVRATLQRQVDAVSIPPMRITDG